LKEQDVNILFGKYSDTLSYNTIYYWGTILRMLIMQMTL